MKWSASWAQGTMSFYVISHPKIDGRRTVALLHRWIMDCPKELQVDHMDHDTLNNQRNNLRNVTRAMNQHNKKMNVNNTSGVQGVVWHHRAKKWQVQLKNKTETIYLGTYADLDKATEVAHQARIRLMPGYINKKESA